MTPQLSILIATQGRRNPRFRGLLQLLMRQVRRHKGLIEVIAYWNNAERSIGDIRAALLNEAQGEYVCFIDDDDAIPDYYCDEIMKALGKDYVGFQVALFSDGEQMPPVFHSLRYQVWQQDDKGYYRGVTHLNPVKRSLALQGHFISQGAGEDANWAREVTPLVKDENYIDKVMYFYYHDKHDTSFGGDRPRRFIEYGRPRVRYRYFRFHPLSALTSRKAV